MRGSADHPKIMRKRIVNSKEFEKLMEGLSTDLNRASIHYELYKNLTSSVEKYQKVLRNSNTFWSLTFDTHLNLSIYCLCRAYDQEKSSLHLKSWLETIMENLDLFSYGEHKRRLADNPYAESLASSAKKPDERQLEEDLKWVTVSEENETVTKLQMIRNTGYAHRGYSYTLRSPIQGESVSLTFEEFEKMIDKGLEILNRYSVLFKSLTYSPAIVGGNDFRYVLETLQDGYEKNETEFQAELDRYSSNKND